MDNEEKIKEMEQQISNLETELQATKEHLKKYTAPASRKVYYERNKEKEKQRAKEYKETFLFSLFTGFTSFILTLYIIIL